MNGERQLADVVAQAYRLRLAARCLDLSPVFIQDEYPLVAELFNQRGRLKEIWTWRVPEVRHA